MKISFFFLVCLCPCDCITSAIVRFTLWFDALHLIWVLSFVSLYEPLVSINYHSSRIELLSLPIRILVLQLGLGVSWHLVAQKITLPWSNMAVCAGSLPGPIVLHPRLRIHCQLSSLVRHRAFTSKPRTQLRQTRVMSVRLAPPNTYSRKLPQNLQA